MARSRFSGADQDVVSQRVDVRVREGPGSRSGRGEGGGSSQQENTQKHLIWWSALYITLALLVVIMVSAWTVRAHGGFTSPWKDATNPITTFNYHPLFMVIAFMLLSGIADILYRLGRNSNKLCVKITHGCIQLTAFSFIVAALCAVFWYHDAMGSLHFQSAHSWIGLIIVLLVSCQWLIGFCGLLWPGFRSPLRDSYVMSHRFTGRCIFLLSMANILIGINKVSGGTTVMNVTALLVICFALNGAYILANNAFARGGGGAGYQQEEETTAVYERRTSIHSANGVHEENKYINISGTGGAYQSMDDPIVKESMNVGRDTFNKFQERLDKKSHLGLPAEAGVPAGTLPATTTTRQATTVITD